MECKGAYLGSSLRSSQNAANRHTLAVQAQLAALVDQQRKLEIAQRIRQLREDAGLTQPAVAERIGVTLRGYQKQEKTGGIAWENVEALGRLYGIDPLWIVKGDAETPDFLDGSQLDRIEAKLDSVLANLEGPAETDAADEFPALQPSSPSAPPTETSPARPRTPVEAEPRRRAR